MDKDLQTVDQVFKALADPTRIRILGLLAGGEICVCHIHESLKLPQSLVSRHLAYLRKAGLVDTRRAGLWIHYRLADRRNDVMRTLLDTVYHCVGHLPTVARDAKRLERKTGCCVVNAPAPGFDCCHQQDARTSNPASRPAANAPGGRAC